MSEKLQSALIIASPGPFRDSLRALATTMPCVGMVAEVCSITSFIEHYSELQPDLVLVDGNEQDRAALNAFASFRRRDRHSRVCWLIDSDNGPTESVYQAADLVLPKGYPASDLADVLEEILANGKSRN